jgi:hypothetical protein
MIELENKRANLGFAILCTGGISLLAGLVMPPVWALYVTCFTFGIQAFLLSHLIAVIRLQKSSGVGHRTVAQSLRDGLPAHPRARWQNTEDFLTQKQGTVVLLEAVIDE